MNFLIALLIWLGLVRPSPPPVLPLNVPAITAQALAPAELTVPAERGDEGSGPWPKRPERPHP